MKAINANNTSCKKALMKELMAHDFAAYDLQLFLDTHPSDQKAMECFAKETKAAKELKKEYEEKYGPITAAGAKKEVPWQWIKSPWTWEGV